MLVVQKTPDMALASARKDQSHQQYNVLDLKELFRELQLLAGEVGHPTESVVDRPFDVRLWVVDGVEFVSQETSEPPEKHLE